jgi:nitrogen fixation protein FixH
MRKSLRRVGYESLIAMVFMLGAPQEPSAAQATELITLTTKPAPLLLGQNHFEVVVKDAHGRPVNDASVSLRLVMPPTPDMAEMRTDVTLKPAGDGKYSGNGMMTMAGPWNVTITVKRRGQDVVQKKMNVTVALKAPPVEAMKRRR